MMQFSQHSHNKYFQEVVVDTKTEEIDIFQGIVNSFDPKTPLSFRRRSSLYNSTIDVAYDNLLKHSDVIQKLITKCNNNNLKQKYFKLCHEFGINMKKLQGLPQGDERENYVIQCMSNNIQEHLKSWENKMQTKQIAQRDLEYREQRTLNQLESRGILNLYDWLQIESQYYQIQKKLKYALVDAINDTKNEETVKKYFAKQTQLEAKQTASSTARYMRSTVKVTSQTKMSSRNLSTRSHTQTNSEVALLGSKHQPFFKQMASSGIVKQTNYLFDGDVGSPRRIKNAKEIDRPPLKIDINTNVIDSGPELQFSEWNWAIEKGFLASRASAQATLMKEIKSSSWNRSALYPIIYSETKKNGGTGINSQKREELLKSYADGDQLSSEELKFLTNTSYLINKNIDKKFIQRAINYLDKEVIQEIELNIAEQILQQYYESHELVKMQRFTWMKNRNDGKRAQIKSDAAIQKSKKKKLDNAQQLLRIKQKLVAYLKDIDRKKIEKSKQELMRKVKNKQEGPLQNRFVVQFRDIIMNMVKKKRLVTGQQVYENFFARNGPKSAKKGMFTVADEEQNVDQIQRLFHPASKVLIMPEVKENTNPVAHSRHSTMLNKEHQRYRLGIKNNTDTNNVKSNTFQEFYSGGPEQVRAYASPQMRWLNQEEDDRVPTNQRCKWINASIEEIAINKIKAALRYFIYKKKYQKIIELKRRSKNEMLEKQIKKCIDSKKLFSLMKLAIVQRRKELIQTARLSIHTPRRSQSKKVSMLVSPDEVPIIHAARRSHTKKYSMMQVPTPTLPVFEDVFLRTSKQPSRIQEAVTQPSSPNHHSTEAKLPSQYSKQKERSDNKLKLIIAAKMGNLMIAQTAGFVYNKEDVNCLDSVGNCPLYYCALNGDDKFCRFLVQLGANVNQKCKYGNTPVHMAFKTGKVGIIIEFIHAGADLNILNDQSHTPIAFGSDAMLSKLNLNCYVSAIGDTNKHRIKDNNVAYGKTYDIISGYESHAAENNLSGIKDGLKMLAMKNQPIINVLAPTDLRKSQQFSNSN